MKQELIQYLTNIKTDLHKNNKILKLNNLKGSTAIFIIDMINGFCKAGNLSSPLVNELIPTIKKLLEKAIKNKIEIFALNDAHSKNNPEFNSYQVHCLKDTIESELVSELNYPEIKIINKNSTNGFFVLDTKTKWKWDNIIIVGCCTDICVYQFALTCKTWCNQQNQPINIIVPKSMTTTFDSPTHPSAVINNLFWHSMLKNGITIVKDIR